MIVTRAILKASDAVDRVATVLTAVLLGLMTITTFAQIMGRVLFSALSWSEELARYALIWLTFIGAGCVHKRTGHITITLLQDAFTEKIRKVFIILAQLLCIAVFLVAIYHGFSYMKLMGSQLSAALRIPMRYMYAAIPVGCLVLMLHSGALIVKTCTQKEAEK